jgi:DNA-binding transcriptional LysR family regulator
MQFESLKIFCDVVRHRSFSLAATANAVSQSAASQVVLQLEKRLGVQLIDRSTRPFRVTRPGQLFYEGCRDLVEQYLEIEANVRNAEAEIASSVQVAAIYSVGLGDMSQLVERFTRLHPNVRVHVEYLHPDRVCERVLEGTADFGLVSFPRRSRELESVSWRDEEMVLTCARGHRLAGQRSIRVSQLDGEKFVGFDRGLEIRREIDRFLRDNNVGVDVVLEFDNIENIKKAIEISAGVALLPLPTLGRELQSGTLVAVPLTGRRLVRPLGIIHRKNHKLTASASRLVDLLRGESSENGNSSGGRRGRANSVPRVRANGMHGRRNGVLRGPKR